MFKKLMAKVLVLVIMLNAICELSLYMPVYASGDYKVRTIVDTTIREDCYQDSKIVRNVKKGETLTIVDEITNKYGNLWYKVKNEGYIYSEKVEKTASYTPKLVTLNFKVRTTVDTTIRKGYYESTDIVRNVKKGTLLTIVGEIKNEYGNLWYKVDGGGYIYSGKVQKELISSPSKQEPVTSHTHSYVQSGYGSSHPHYIEYKCTGCESAYCSTETKKVSGCNICYPHVHSYVQSGYGNSHPHYIEYQCTGCESGYCSTETKKVSGCNECYPHEHDYQFQKYDNSHPHTAHYKCSCGSEYCSSETIIMDGCLICHPNKGTTIYEDEEDTDECEYGHDFEFVGYDEHPHYALYECLVCGTAICGDKTNKLSSCTKCNPKKYNERHEHEYEFIGFEDAHPHYAEYECDCGDGYFTKQTKEFVWCEECFPEYADDEEEYKPGDEHECIFVFSGKYEFLHPHYAINQCRFCGKRKIDLNRIDLNNRCMDCNSPYDSYPDKLVKIYNVDYEQPISLPDSAKMKLLTQAELLHIGLDVCGLVPGIVGMTCDGVNVAYYLIEGDIEDALLSGVSFIPFVGYVTGTGKLVEKAGVVLITKIVDKIGDAKRLRILDAITNFAPLSDNANYLIRASGQRSDEFLEAVSKISKNADLPLNKVFNNGEVLISKDYTGTITSAAGLKYTYDSRKNMHSMQHILERHAPANPIPGDPTDLFDLTHEEIFKLIDETHMNKTPLPNMDTAGKYSVGKVYETGQRIGTNGQTKMRIVYSLTDPDAIVTAYPIK